MKYDMKALAHDFWYGKPHQERRLGDLYIDKTGLYKHREWRGFPDTMYYFYNIWLYNYAHMVMDVVRYGGLINFAKGVWRYRWVGQTYLPVLHWFDRGMEGMRGEGLKASAWHYRGMVNATIFQFQRMFSSDANIRGGKKNYRWHHNVAHNETVWGGVFYPWHGKLTNVPMEMIPYFVTCHVNSHTVLNYIDAVQSIGLPGDLSSQSRFVRAAFVRMHAQSEDSEQASVSQFYHILDAVAQQRGCCALEDGKFEITLYSSCCNADQGIYYYKTYENSALTAVSLFREDLEGRVPVSYALETELRVRWSN